METVEVINRKESSYSEKPNSSNTISRQAAIDEIGEWIKAFLENGHKESAADARLIQDGIIQLPSAQPERKTGVWLEDEDDPESVKTDGYCAYCSACKEWSEYLTAYCGSCGADMRGTWNETN